MLLLLLTALAHPPVEAAPGWVAYAWTPAEGMPSDQATRVARGPDGAVWVATYDGLVRLLGDQVTVLAAAAGLRDARVVDLALDAGGAPWVVTEHGLLARWTGDRMAYVDVGESTGKIYGLGRLGDDLWLLGGDGLTRLVDGAPTPVAASGIAPLVHEVLPLPDGSLLVLASEAAFHVSGGQADPILPHARAALVDAGGTAWIAYQRSLWRWRPGTEPVEVDLHPTGHLCSVRDAPGGARVGSWDGQWWDVGDAGVGPARRGDLCEAALTTPTGTSWYRVGDWLTRDGEPVARAGRVSALLALGDDDLLAATEAMGVVRVRRALLSPVGPGTPLTEAAVYAVATDGRAVWTATKGFEVFRVRDGEVGAVRVDQGPRSETTQVMLTSLRVRPGGGALVASMLGVCELAEDLGPCVPTSVEETDHVFLDPLGRTWLSTEPGLIARAPGEEPRAWPLAVSKLGGYRHPRPLAWHGGALWMGDLVGDLYRLSSRGLERARVGTGKLRHIGDAADGSLWVTPEGQGICRVRPAAAASLAELPPGGELAVVPLDADIRCVGAAQGLSEDLVHAVLDDGLGRTWYSTNHGIGWVHTEALHRVLDGDAPRVYPVVLDRTDGMLDDECNGGDPPSAARTDDGRLWFATMRGLAVLDPAAVPDLPPPEVRWTRFEAGAQAPSPRPLADATALAADERRVRVAWAADTFDHPEQLTWRVRLLGHDRDWTEARGMTSIEYANLPPGALELVVQAGRAGRWGPPARLAIRRQPVLRETAAFPFLVAAAAAAAIGLLLWGRLRAAHATQRRLQREVDAQTLELRARNDRLQAQTLELSERAAEIASQAERLRQQDRLRTRFIANLSHELRTPLTLVTGPARALGAVDGLPPEAWAAAEIISRNAARLDELVDQLLDVARLESGTLPLKARRVDLGALVARVADRFGPAALAQQIALEVDVAPAPVFLDPDKIDKVLSNLLSNALKFTPSGGRVAVRVRPPGGEGEGAAARVEVEDTGIGVDPAAQARLFERFFQVDDADARRFQGAGVGLSLAMELVQLHGGELGVESTPGVGSRFWFTLPGGAAHLAVEELDLDGPPAAPPPEPPAAAEGDGGAVLVVEDNPDMRAWIVTHLAARFRVRAVPDGLAAIVAVREARPDVIVSDVMMPGMDGLTLCRRLRADAETADLPILLLSAKGTEPDRVAGLEVADDYLTKPFFPAELVVRIQRLLPSVPEPPDVSPQRDRELRERLEAEVLARIADPELSIAALARVMASSRRQLHRDVTRLTGLSPTDYLQQVRLDLARRLLEQGAHATVAEVAHAVGLSPNYLARLYRARWGCSPSDHLARSARPR